MKKYLLVFVLVVYAVSAHAAFITSDIKSKPKVSVPKSVVNLAKDIPSLQEVSTCKKELETLQAAYNSNYASCVMTRTNQFEDAANSQLGSICASYGFTDFSSCLAPGAMATKIITTCQVAAGLAALNAKFEECKQLASELSSACKQAKADVEKLAAERKVAGEALKRAFDDFDAINKKLADKNQYIKNNKCPIEMQIPDSMIKQPEIVNGTFKILDYTPPK